MFSMGLRNERKMKKFSKMFCHEVKQEGRSALFEGFWNGIDWKRTIFVSSLVHCRSAAKKRTNENHSRRNKTLLYHLKIGKTSRQVCNKTFLSTFCIAENKNAERSETFRKSKKKGKKTQSANLFEWTSYHNYHLIKIVRHKLINYIWNNI